VSSISDTRRFSDINDTPHVSLVLSACKDCLNFSCRLSRSLKLSLSFSESSFVLFVLAGGMEIGERCCCEIVGTLLEQ
jgi:hypothetical protein